jgi:predicted dehydrogenase
MKKLRCCVIGLGRIGYLFHIPAIVAHPQFELVGVSDRSSDRLEEANEAHGVATFHSTEEMLQTLKPDLTIIASPTHFHLEHTRLAFQAGSDVFCEKPMAASLDEADQMIDAMQHYDKKLMVFQPRRLSAEVIALKTILGQNVLGEIYLIERARTDFVQRNDWQSQKKFAGGMLLNYGSHAIDELMFLTQSKLTKQYCGMRKILSVGDAEDVVKIILHSETDAILDIGINMASAIKQNKWTILGTRGSITYDEAGKQFHLRYLEATDLPKLKLQTDLAADNRSYNTMETLPWHDEYIPVPNHSDINAYDCCYEYYALNQPPFLPIHESRELMRILFDCERIASEPAK